MILRQMILNDILVLVLYTTILKRHIWALGDVERMSGIVFMITVYCRILVMNNFKKVRDTMQCNLI